MAGGLRKAVDERLYLSRRSGGGMLRREVWVDNQDRVVRYNLAYVNHFIFAADNGRAVGYDSAHGTHHRHYKGKVTAVSFHGFEQIEARFEKEWRKLAKEAQHAKD